jgi:hypothetical protein
MVYELSKSKLEFLNLSSFTNVILDVDNDSLQSTDPASSFLTCLNQHVYNERLNLKINNLTPRSMKFTCKYYFLFIFVRVNV